MKKLYLTLAVVGIFTTVFIILHLLGLPIITPSPDAYIIKLW
jgi:hypothetical protein